MGRYSDLYDTDADREILRNSFIILLTVLW